MTQVSETTGLPQNGAIPQADAEGNGAHQGDRSNTGNIAVITEAAETIIDTAASRAIASQESAPAFGQGLDKSVVKGLARDTTKALPDLPKEGRSVNLKALQWNAGLFRWFLNLPLGRKQVLALLICELIPVLGAAAATSIFLTQGLRSQLRDQADTEVAVTQIQYNAKINQMGLGSRTLSESSAILEALDQFQENGSVSPDLNEQLRLRFRNEQEARNIEYVTLVDINNKVVTSSNNNRRGEELNPGGLVTLALTQGVQVKGTEIVSWEDLQKEGAKLPSDFSPQEDGLVRFTVTPIRDLNTKALLGAIIYGDLVNGKLSILEQTLDALDQGYSAIYMRKSDGQYTLVNSLRRLPGQALKVAQRDIPLPTTLLLDKAIQQPQGTPAIDRISIDGDRTYTIAAKVLPSRIFEQPGGSVPIYENAKAILVHGTAEDRVNGLLNRSLQSRLLILGLAIGLISLWTLIFRRTVLKPLLDLESAAQRFAEGDRTQRADVFAMDEVGHLTLTFNAMADNIEQSELALYQDANRQAEEAQRARLLNDITTQMRDSLDESRIMSAAVRGVRQVLDADRVLLYQFDSNQQQGIVVAESVVAGWNPLLGEVIADPCFADKYIDLYRRGRVHTMDDIEGLDPQNCYDQAMRSFNVRANLVVPILQNERLRGLFCAHQCRSPRRWQAADTSFVQKVATQLGFALEQADLSQQREAAKKTAETLLDEQRRYTENLQLQLVNLLSEVEGAASGDLTVRADVTAGEIGTVADFFNSIVESLRQLVTQVKSSAVTVNASIGDNEQAIRGLADEALRQADEITKALGSVERMTQSIQAVATNAQQAAEVSRSAAAAATSGGSAVDLTVQNIVTLRETIGETAKKVKRLGESSQQISKVVFLINQIATQTNLLAINAGIEAARAGEQGQGFAVVAEEIGELATRSSAATQEIEQLVEAIQRETSEVVEAMDLGTTQVVEGTKLADETKHSLQRIMTVSSQIDDLVKSISDTTVSQASTSQSITSLMQELASIATHTSQSSLKVSDSLRQTVSVAKELQDSVGTFKVS